MKYIRGMFLKNAFKFTSSSLLSYALNFAFFVMKPELCIVEALVLSLTSHLRVHLPIRATFFIALPCNHQVNSILKHIFHNPQEELPN
jgi:hypothetical protein